jgi:beta-phosphoglucomutase-like phosphatase (HAD superfamily)
MVTSDLIIFDCDGVLIDSEVLSCRCLSEVLRRYGVDVGVESGAGSVFWTKPDGGARTLY